MLEGLEPLKNKRLTRIDEVLVDLDDKDKKILLAALDNPDWSSNGLSLALKQRGISISPSTITRHRENKKLAK
jgi:hypothetical protein